MDRKTATIQDVARVAGVSTATVSRTLSKPSVVAATTREAVLSAVAETGYRVNTTASNLRRQRTGSIIVLLPNIANPFFSQILAGLASVLTPAQYGMLIADTQSGPDPDQLLGDYLTSGQADGLVLLDGSLSPEVLATPGRPPVVMACEWMGGDLPSVRVENGRGAATAVAHLAQLGHRAIGHVTGPRGNVLTESRLEGFRVGLASMGLPLRDDWVLEGDFSMDSGAAAARHRIDTKWEERVRLHDQRCGRPPGNADPASGSRWRSVPRPCSSPPTRWRSASWARCRGRGSPCPTIFLSSGSTISRSPSTSALRSPRSGSPGR